MKSPLLRKITAVLLCLCLFPLPARAAEPVVTLSSPEDWKAFAANCRLDSWSQGRQVVLACDLELDESCPSIPTFGGSFDGQGHTIQGLTLTNEGSYQGLFRRIQPGGSVKDLTVSGVVTPSGSPAAVGGIAGENGGSISHCRFRGVVLGSGQVGGIAGLNLETGVITGCSASGTVSGEHSTGGIAGENRGSLLRCSSRACVNTEEAEISPELDGINWEQLGSTENFAACTDTGGISGLSSGLVQGCVNRGPVGYPHTGYNVGGIAGRQSGALEDCENYGAIQGRKEVGGIVGQMEPYTLLEYQRDTLQKLADELDAMSAALDRTIDSTQASTHTLSRQLDTVTNLTDSARQNVSDMAGHLETLGEDTISSANELSDRVSWTLDRSVPVTSDLEDGSSLLGDAIHSIEQASSSLESAGEDASRFGSLSREGISRFKEGSQHAQDAQEKAGEAFRLLQNDPEDEENVQAARTLLEGAYHDLSDAGASLTQGLEQLEQASKELENTPDSLKQSARRFQSGLDTAGDAADAVSSAAEGIASLADGLAAKEPVTLSHLDEDYYRQEEHLGDTLDQLKTSLDDLNQTARGTGDTLSDDLREVNSRFQSIAQLLRDEGEDDHIIDVSQEEDETSSGGTVSRCQNFGSVEGDVNVGGLTGSMAIEYDFDPEDDVDIQGASSFRFQYQVRAVLQDSVNYGDITARKDCVGGGAGFASLGLIQNCGSEGAIESTGGKYVGGIAGSSQSAVRDSWAKCSLSGSRSVGGIAGLGSDIRGCRSLVSITEGSSALGAIAGEVEAESHQQDNFFVSDTLGGIDGTSYTGRAEPLPYPEFLELENLPQPFSRLTLTFTAKGRLVSSRPLAFGGSLAGEPLPQVPEKEGFYGEWSLPETDSLKFDTVIEASYTPWLTALASPDGQILSEGRFPPQAVLRVSPITPDLPDSSGDLLGSWRVSVSDAEGFTALRIALPSDAKRPALWTLTQEGWSRIPFTREGSYLRIPLTANTADLCLTSLPLSPLVWILPTVGVLLLALIVFLLWRRKRRHPKH